MPFKIIFCFLFLPVCISAQLIDDFTDGDFTNNPSWSGDIHQFEINSSKQLHLKSSGSDTSFLSTPYTSINNTEWRFWVKQSFNSSDNNHSRFYLVSDNADLEKPLKGYFVQIGSSDDNIALYRQEQNLITQIISGALASTGNSVNQIRIKVLRDMYGNWELLCDDTGGENYISEGFVLDNSFINTSYTGIFSKYTSSNSTKFYFDEIYIGPIIIDTIPPELINIKVISPNEVSLTFSENLDTTSSQLPQNYLVDNGIGEPNSAELKQDDHTVVNLKFAHSFSNGTIYKIRITNISDTEANILVETYDEFSFYQVQAFDIVINEIMADPDPPRELPVAEYVELYNTTLLPIDLTNWKIEIGNTIKTFPGLCIPPDGYLIICKESTLGLYGPIVQLLTSSTSISNEGSTIILKNEKSNIISTVTYSKNWFENSFKEEGGWSLEQIDPSNPCGGKDNWKASVDMEGGTPGRKNSVFADNADHIAPEMLRIGIINERSIQLYYTEPLDSSSLLSPSNFRIDNNIDILETIAVGPDFSSVILNLEENLQTGVTYYLTINDTVTDCVGNIIPLYSSIMFGLPIIPVFNDIVINEILFNPKDYIVNGNDFVEIYNRSDKVFDIQYLMLSSTDPKTMISSSYTICNESYLLFPEEYLTLTKSAEVVKTQYYTTNPDGFLELSSFPAYNNDEGIVEISLADETLIDKVIYHEDMHFELLNTTDGISLERVSYDRPSFEPTNWHSASGACDFATPAYKNSMFSTFKGGNSTIEISPKIFSPNDSYGNNFLNICYKIDESGFVANITIYNSSGQIIKLIKRNELLGTNGCYTWDGTTEEGNKAAIGIYIVLFEVFNLSGKVERYKKVCVLGGRL